MNRNADGDFTNLKPELSQVHAEPGPGLGPSLSSGVPQVQLEIDRQARAAATVRDGHVKQAVREQELFSKSCSIAGMLFFCKLALCYELKC